MSVWKKLTEMFLPEADYKPGWRTNSVWDRAAEMERQPAKQQAPAQQKPSGPKPPATGPVVWRGAQMKDTDLFVTKKDKNTGENRQGGLIPHMKDPKVGGTVTRAPDGSGMAVVPHGYAIDQSVWKDWSPTRSRAEINATTDSAKGGSSTNPTAAKTFDVLMQGRVSDNNGKQSILVTKIVWAPLDRSSLETQTPEARQAKLELLMDTDDPGELAQMFPAKPQGQGLQRPQPNQNMAPNPLASPTAVQWTKGGASEPPARDSSWQDIDLTRVPKKKV